jgi:hypothetical protein
MLLSQISHANHNADPNTPSAAAPAIIFDQQYTGEHSELLGYYAEKVTLTTLDETPFGEAENTSYYYSLTRIGAINGELYSHAQSCTSDVASSWLVQVSITDEVTQKIAPLTGKLSFENSGGKLQVSREWVGVPLGVHLDKPLTEELPSDPSDPRIFDAEGDGNPGISVDIQLLWGLIATEQIYAIRIERGAWEAEVDAQGIFKGFVQDDSKQQVIGASDEMFARNMASRHHPDRNKSTLLLLPLEGDDWNCDKFIAQRAQIFKDF